MEERKTSPSGRYLLFQTCFIPFYPNQDSADGNSVLDLPACLLRVKVVNRLRLAQREADAQRGEGTLVETIQLLRDRPGF